MSIQTIYKVSVSTINQGIIDACGHPDCKEFDRDFCEATKEADHAGTDAYSELVLWAEYTSSKEARQGEYQLQALVARWVARLEREKST